MTHGPNRAYIGNIPYKCTIDDIKTHFGAFGKILLVDLKNGFGFIVRV